MDCSLPCSSIHGIFQARVLEWVAISFSRGSSRPRDRTQVSHIAGRHFTIWAIRDQIQYWPTFCLIFSSDMLRSSIQVDVKCILAISLIKCLSEADKNYEIITIGISCKTLCCIIFIISSSPGIIWRKYHSFSLIGQYILWVLILISHQSISQLNSQYVNR